MPEETTELESPIDVLRLVHKALRAEAARVDEEADRIEIGGTLGPFRSAYNVWAAASLYISEKETAMISRLPAHSDGSTNNVASARLGQAEPDRLEMVRRAMVAANEDEHIELAQKLEDVLTVLNDEINRTSVIHRTKQHLCGSVMALRFAQDDHLENEAAFVLPVLREEMTESQQLEAARGLLLDEESEDPTWILDWIAGESTPQEREWLNGLTSRFQGATAPTKRHGV